MSLLGSWSHRLGALAFGLLLSMGMPASAAPASVQGLVTRVVDGDTLWLTPPGKPPIVIRLHNIDAPESCQAWGPEATAALSKLALNKLATLQINGKDPHGRTVGALLIEDIDVGRFMVESGHAWSIRTRWDQGPMVKQEKMARALARGLHATPGAIQPQEFRRVHGPCAAQEPVVGNVAGPSDVARVKQLEAEQAAANPRYRCDGRTLCSQMTSCAEAKFFLARCPNVHMDGDRNGIPCERQWCTP